jgi:pantoate--beta-alanine ligase
MPNRRRHTQVTRDLNYPIEIVICPIVRGDRLALSSATYISTPSSTSRNCALSLASAAKEAYENGERDAEKLRGKMKEGLAGEPLAQVQYISCADYDTLEELETVTGKTLLSMAVFVGKTRLIDNFVLG